MIKNALIFITGAATGAGVAYVALKKYFEDKASEEIAEARETFRIMRHADTVADEAPDENPEEEKQEEKANSKDKELYREVVQKTNYGAIAKEPTAPVILEPKTPAPYTITEDEYNTIDNYDKQVLDYYEEDGTLVNEDGEIISSEDYIGVENLALFDDTGSLYIRHEHTGIDYEVVLYHMSYATANGEFYDEDEND